MSKILKNVRKSAQGLHDAGFIDSTTLRTVIGNPRSSGYDRAEADWYVEPRRSIAALLNVEEFTNVHDPACGGGNIPKACLARGIRATGSDLVDRGYGEVQDFLQAEGQWTDIITNPPFALAEAFALHAIPRTFLKVAILQRTTWLEGEKRYKSLFSHGWLSKVWQFRSRISMPPGGSKIEPKGESIAYAWFVFERGNHGPPTLGWLP